MPRERKRSVLEGRRLKFTRIDEKSYEVAAVAVSRVLRPQYVYLGVVVRGRRSTDSKVVGTRQRRSGKGAPVWRAEVPRLDWRSNPGGMSLSRLQGSYGGGWRLVEGWSGQPWDRRVEAAEALVSWRDHPERRETE